MIDRRRFLVLTTVAASWWPWRWPTATPTARRAATPTQAPTAKATPTGRVVSNRVTFVVTG